MQERPLCLCQVPKGRGQVCACLDYNNDLLEWLTDCVSAGQTVIVYQQKVQESSSCSVYKLEVGSKASEGMDLLVRVRTGR